MKKREKEGEQGTDKPSEKPQSTTKIQPLQPEDTEAKVELSSMPSAMETDLDLTPNEDKLSKKYKSEIGKSKKRVKIMEEPFVEDNAPPSKAKTFSMIDPQSTNDLSKKNSRRKSQAFALSLISDNLQDADDQPQYYFE